MTDTAGNGGNNGAAAPAPATTPTTPAVAPAGGAPATGNESGEKGPSIAEILQFDPFGPEEKPGDSKSPGSDGKPATTSADGTTKPGVENKDGKQPPAAAAPGTPPGSTPATNASPPAAPNLEQLLREQTDAIKQMASERGPGAQPKPEADKPRFNLGIPAPVLAALRSEDEKEFATGMHAVINGIANHLWGQFNDHLEKVFAPKLQQDFQAHAQSAKTSEQVSNDFYGVHKNLNNPMLRPLVQQAGVQVAQARVAAGKPVGWSEELRDEIAEAVYQVVPHLRPTAETAPGTPPAPPVPNGRFVSGGGGPRPAAPSGADDKFGADLL